MKRPLGIGMIGMSAHIDAGKTTLTGVLCQAMASAAENTEYLPTETAHLAMIKDGEKPVILHTFEGEIPTAAKVQTIISAHTIPEGAKTGIIITIPSHTYPQDRSEELAQLVAALPDLMHISQAPEDDMYLQITTLREGVDFYDLAPPPTIQSVQPKHTKHTPWLQSTYRTRGKSTIRPTKHQAQLPPNLGH